MSDAASAPLSEFELIRRYFTRPAQKAALGVGDDCAPLCSRHGRAICSRSVRTCWSAGGISSRRRLRPRATRRWRSTCPTSPPWGPSRALHPGAGCPRPTSDWLAGLAHGMLVLADAHGCELIGGDTTRGPLNLCLTVFGDVPPQAAALRRDAAARAGDDIWVSGTLATRAWPWATAAANGCCPSRSSRRCASAWNGPRARRARPGAARCRPCRTRYFRRIAG